MKKMISLVLLAIIIDSASTIGQETNQCALVVIAEVKHLGEQGSVSGQAASYRLADYSVIEIVKGQLEKKEITVSHLILTGRELDELRVGDKVLLCLGESWHVYRKNGRTISYGMKEADYEGELLMVDSGRR